MTATHATTATTGRRTAGPARVPDVISPAVVTGVVRHVRNRPVRREFTHRVLQWLVDVDDLPRLPRPWRWMVSFRAADHLGDPARTIRANLTTYAATEGVDLTGCRVLMLANARTLGYVFDPLTVFWCVRQTGELACVVAEVRNTYGERHCYLVHPDQHGWAHVDKAFYVSPFVTVEGTYDMRFELGADRLAVTVVLHQGGEPLFVATTRARTAPASRAAIASALLRYPLMPQRVTALIHWHGVRLWLRRLPVVPRRPHQLQEGVR